MSRAALKAAAISPLLRMTSGRIGWGKGSEMYHCLGGFRAFEANLPFETSGSELSVVVSALCLGLTMRGRALIVILRSSV